jgi:hypothetical protein
VLGDGEARSWVEVDRSGKPLALGISFTETALDNLPQSKPEGADGYEYTLSLPKEASVTAIDHVSIDWNPKGHIPPGIYDVPHFDFHFYTISPSMRSKITLDAEDMKRCQTKPDAKYMPKGYMYAPGGEYKGMGAHWVDTQTPELHGKKFTQTFVWGSYNGKIAFIEPMVAMSYLRSQPKMFVPIKQPVSFGVKGKYYPTKYSIKYDQASAEYSVTLFGFVKR